MTSMLKGCTIACVGLAAIGLGACVAPRPAPPPSPPPTAASPASNATEADSWVLGKVIDREDGNVIPNASLTLYFQEIESTPRAPVRSKSNQEGKFDFGPVTSGLYCILASSFGYHTVAREFTLQKGKRDNVNIVLDRQSVRVSVQRCLPDRASIRMCPADSTRVPQGTDGTRCAGQP